MDAAFKFVSTSRRVREDRRFVVGRGNYVADIKRDGMLHVAIVPSAHPAARILSIDAAAALHVPGVHHVLTGEELAAAVDPLLNGLDTPQVRRYPLAGLSEDLPWARDFAPFFELPREVARMTQHAFGELLNNAIDHSEGSHATVSLRQTPSHVQLLVSDDGRGVFDKLQEAFDLGDPYQTLFVRNIARLPL